MENNQFYQIYGDLREKILQEKLRAKRIGNRIWFFLIFICLLMLFIGAKWYWFPIFIAIAFLFGFLYSYNISKKIEKETGLNIQKQELVLMGKSPSMGQPLSSENYQKLVKWTINESDKKNNSYTEEAGNEDQPFELIPDEEAYEIKKENEKKEKHKLILNKILIIFVILLVISVVVVGSRNKLLESKNEEKTTMDILYENMEKSMQNEDIESIKELTNKAVLLLPENEREELIELQTRFGKYGYSALTENETRLMQELNTKAINLLPENDRTKLDNLMEKLSDFLTEKTTMVQKIRNMFPTLSQESAEKFARKANDRKLTDEELLTWADELAAKGGVFLSDSQKEEMASLWWKAVGKLPVEQQDFIQSLATKIRLGQEITLEEEGLFSTYAEHCLSLLSQEDKDKYLYLRSEALEEALKRESGTINVKDYIKDKFPPVFSLYLSSLDDLDSYEKEFIDLLEKLPEEEQEYYAKKVYEYGFYREILEVVKEGKPITVYSDAYDKALYFIDSEEYEKALTYLEIAVKTDILSLKAQAYYNIGYCYNELGNFSKSVEAYKQTTRIDPDDADAYYNLGYAYNKLGFDKDAMEEYKQAIRIDPDHANAHIGLGVNYGKLGNYTKAIESFKQAIRIEPDNAKAHSGLGGVYHLIGDRKSALNEYEILKELDINSANELFDLIYE